MGRRAALETVTEWQGRPLDACYPLVFFDAIRVKIRDEGFVQNKAVYIALGILPGYCGSQGGGPLGESELILTDDNGDQHRFYFETRSEEHTSELQSLMRISYAVFC